jgi:hypothetical protein
VFGPDVTEEFQDPYNQSVKIKVTYPQWCKYTVFKMVNGQRVAFHALERWKENYATQSGKTECPNAMWRKRPTLILDSLNVITMIVLWNIFVVH